MSRILDLILNSTTPAPVRRTTRVVVIADPDSGITDAQPVQDELYSLSPEGSLDRVVIDHARVLHCGCSATKPVGGRCADCGMFSCVDCFGRCARCLRPLCLEHSQLIVVAGQQNPLRFCRRCGDQLRRRQLGSKLLRGLLSPFVVFDGRGQEKRS
jgi:hypothetical protein